jgi:hypothetical protein
LGFNLVDANGKPVDIKKATQAPIDILTVMLDQSKVNAFFPTMLPILEAKWGVPLDKILLMPSVLHTNILDENGKPMELRWLGFTDGYYPIVGDSKHPSTFPIMKTCIGPNRMDTAMALFNFGTGKADPFGSTVPLNVSLEQVKFVNEKGKESTMRYGDVLAYMANFINSPLGKNETMPMRVRAIQAMFDQAPMPVACVADGSFNKDKK